MCLNEPYYKKLDADKIHEILEDLQRTVIEPNKSWALVSGRTGAIESLVAFDIAILEESGEEITPERKLKIRKEAERVCTQPGLYTVSCFGVEYLGIV